MVAGHAEGQGGLMTGLGALQLDLSALGVRLGGVTLWLVDRDLDLRDGRAWRGRRCRCR